jgi:hypothetical protein
LPSIPENLQKNGPWNQNSSRDFKFAPNLPKTAEKSPSRLSKIKQKWWTVGRFHTFRYSHPPAKKDTKKKWIGQKSYQKKLQSDQAGYLGSILATPGRNLLPTWFQLAQLAANLIPTWSILLHLAAKLCRKAAKLCWKFQPNCPPDPQEPTRLLQTKIFFDFRPLQTAEPPNRQTTEQPNCRIAEQPAEPPNRRSADSPNNRTTEQPNNQTTDQPKNRTAEPPNSQRTEQPNRRIAQQPINRTTEPPNHRTAKQPNCRTTEQPNNRTAEQPKSPNRRTAELPYRRTAEQPNRRTAEQQLWPGPRCIDPGPSCVDRDPMFRPSPPILPLLVAVFAPTWRNIAENLQKNELWNQNNTREPKSAPTLPKTTEKSHSRPSKIKQKWWTVLRFHTFCFSHPPAKEDTENNQNLLEIVPKEDTKWPSWLSWQHLGNSWRQLAANLVPTWSILLHLAAKLCQASLKIYKKNEPWNQNSSRDLESAPNLPKTAEKSLPRRSKIKQKSWTVRRFHTFRYSHPSAKKDTTKKQHWSEIVPKEDRKWPRKFFSIPHHKTYLFVTSFWFDRFWEKTKVNMLPQWCFHSDMLIETSFSSDLALLAKLQHVSRHKASILLGNWISTRLTQETWTQFSSFFLFGVLKSVKENKFFCKITLSYLPKINPLCLFFFQKHAFSHAWHLIYQSSYSRKKIHFAFSSFQICFFLCGQIMMRHELLSPSLLTTPIYSWRRSY